MAHKKICFLIAACSLIGEFRLLQSSITNAATSLQANSLANLETPKSGTDAKIVQNVPIKDNTSYILRVKYPETIKQQPNLRAYYKGYRYDISNMGIISDQSEMSTLFIVITDQIKHKWENERAQYLERVESNPCRAFFLSSKLSTTGADIGQWQISEENIQNVPLRLPEDALVILLNSDLIETLKENPNKFVEAFRKNLEYNPNDDKKTIIYLPELIIKENVTQSQIDLAVINASLGSIIDLGAIHIPRRKEIKIERERIVEFAP